MKLNLPSTLFARPYSYFATLWVQSSPMPCPPIPDASDRVSFAAFAALLPLLPLLSLPLQLLLLRQCSRPSLDM
jgi:hypothetical protein